MTRISHSAKEKYLECSEKYRLHYIEKLRSPILSSPLFGGSAFDDAVSVLLLRLKKDKTEEEKVLAKKDAKEVLVNSLLKTKHNGEDIYIPTHQYAKYSKADFDINLISDEEIENINKSIYAKDYEYFNQESLFDFVEYCRNEIKTKKALQEDDQILFNLINWTSFKNKLLYLLEQYEKDVIPKIEEVFSVQKKVELSAGDHTLIGFIDFEASWHEEPGIVYVCDNKLSSKSYSDKNMLEAEQLATYCEYTENNRGCYVNTEKNLRKKDPKHRIQIVKGQISEELFEKTFDNFGEVVHNIEQGIFEKNLESGCFSFGQRCPYYNTCRGEPSKDFLVDLKEKK